MPRYKGVLSLEDNGPDTPIVHLFDYSSTEDGQNTSSRKSNYRKEVIAVESCIFLGRRNLASIKASQSKPRRRQNKSESTNEKEGAGGKATQPSTNQSKSRNNSENLENKEVTNEKAGTGVKTQPSTNKSKSRNNSENQENKEVTNGEGAEAVMPDKKETNAETKEKEINKEVSEDVKTKERMKNYLNEGQEFQAYILKCPNGPYDYAMKLWDTGRAAPSEAGYPKEGEEVEGVVVDRSEDFLTVACGPNIAFARRKTFLCAGVDPDDLSLPFARLKVSLRRLQEREAQVPAAGWEATPTQVVVTPFDIY